MNTDLEISTAASGQHNVTWQQNASQIPTPLFDLNSHPLMQARLWMQRVFLLVIVVLGLFGNSMIMVIVRRLKAEKSAMNRYLTIVAVSDTVFLLTGPFVTWSDVVIGYSLRDSYVWSCKLIAWLFNAAGTVSAWSLVAMTTQRVVSVVLPHRVNVLCTGRRSWQIIASIVVIASLLHAHMLYGMGLMTARDAIQTTCTIVYPDYARFVLDIWIYLDICIFSFLPFVCLILGNAVLVYKLRMSLRESRLQLGTGSTKQANRSSEALSISITVIVVSMSFIVLTLPVVVNNTMSILYHAEGPPEVLDVEEYAVSYFRENLFFSIGYLNYALNFYLYCLTGARLRNEFLKMISVRRCRSGTVNNY